MNQDVMTLVSRLETRTRQLMLQHEKLKVQLTETQQKLSEQEEYCMLLEEEKEELEEETALRLDYELIEQGMKYEY